MRKSNDNIPQVHPAEYRLRKEYILFHGPADIFYLHDWLCFNGNSVQVLVAEDLHNAPIRHQVPSILAAVVDLGQFSVCGAGVKVRCAGEIGNGEAELFCFCSLIGPHEASWLFQHPSLFGHFLQLFLNGLLVIKRKAAKTPFDFFHDDAPFLIMRS